MAESRTQKMMCDRTGKNGGNKMDFKVLSVLKKFIPADVYEASKDELLKFEVELNTDITKYVTANTPKRDELLAEAKKTAHDEVIAELKLEDVKTVEQLNAYVENAKLSTTEQAKELARIQKEYKDVSSKYETEVATRTKIEQERTLENQYKAIKEYNPTLDEKQLKFVHWDLSNQVTEELPFEQALEAYKAENPVEPQRNPGFNPKFVKPQIVTGQGEDGKEAFNRLVESGKLPYKKLN